MCGLTASVTCYPFDQGRRGVGLRLMRQFARVAAPNDFARIARKR